MNPPLNIRATSNVLIVPFLSAFLCTNDRARALRDHEIQDGKSKNVRRHLSHWWMTPSWELKHVNQMVDRKGNRTLLMNRMTVRFTFTPESSFYLISWWIVARSLSVFDLLWAINDCLNSKRIFEYRFYFETFKINGLWRNNCCWHHLIKTSMYCVAELSAKVSMLTCELQHVLSHNTTL